MTDPRIATWTTWIDGTIKNEFLTMHLHRYAWQEATKLVEDNAELPDSYWWEFMYETYAITQAAAIRRQVDVRRDAASLLRLLNAVQRGAGEIRRTYWIDILWKAEDRIDRDMARRQWDEHYGGTAGDHLDPAIPKADAAAVITAGEDVKKYVDTNIAHASADPVARQVTIKVDDVHQAMDTPGRGISAVLRSVHRQHARNADADLAAGLLRRVQPALDARGVRAAVEPVLRRLTATSSQSRYVAGCGDPCPPSPARMRSV